MELVSTFKVLVSVLVRDCHFIIFNNVRYSTGWVGGFGKSNVRNVKLIKSQSPAGPKKQLDWFKKKLHEIYELKEGSDWEQHQEATRRAEC